MRLRFNLGIVENGRDEYIRQLQAQRRARLNQLEELRHQASEAWRRAELEEEMKAIDERYGKLIQESRDSSL